MVDLQQSVGGYIDLSSFHRGRLERTSKRPFGNIPKRRSFLVVYEGERTEPNYFRSLAQCLPKNWAAMNPATKVHHLVRDLLAYMRKGQ